MFAADCKNILNRGETVQVSLGSVHGFSSVLGGGVVGGGVAILNVVL